MRGFLTTLLLCGLAGALFANIPSSSLLSDGPVTVTTADAGTATTTALMR
jgi:hypothetical protein